MPVSQRGVQKTQRSANVVLEIFSRILDRFSDVGVRREVHHGIGARQSGTQRRVIGDIALDQFEASRQPAKAGGQVVIYHDLVAGTSQRARRMTADVPRSAHHQNASHAPS
jgi:hypothetical protein